MSTKILLIGAAISKNLGGPSLLITTKNVLNKYFDNTEYTFVSPLSIDKPLEELYDTSIVERPSMKKALLAAFAKALLGISIGTKEVRCFIDSIENADLVIDIWGIQFSTLLNQDSFTRSFAEGIHFLIAKLFRKPVVKYTADFGPFGSGWNKFFAKIYLQYMVDLILARSKTSQERLNDLSISTPIRVCPDTAFLLRAQKTSVTEQLSLASGNHPKIGFSVSHMAARHSVDPSNYYETMAILADYIVESIQANILLIPNEHSDITAYDDSYVAKEVWNRMKKQDSATIVLDELSAPELKWVIGQCDAIVATRYHTIVASISQGIPVLAIGWHAKYPEVLQLVGQEEHLCSIKELDIDILSAQFDKIWQSRDQIKSEIQSSLVIVRDDIIRCGDCISLLCKPET